jgi:hypothetical protein
MGPNPNSGRSPFCAVLICRILQRDRFWKSSDRVALGRDVVTVRATYYGESPV